MVHRRTPGPLQKIHLGRRSFYIVPRSHYIQLLREARQGFVDAAEYTRASIGRDLRRKRRKAGMTQAEVATRAGIRTETLSRLESGIGNPTVGTLRRILKALGERVQPAITRPLGRRREPQRD